MDAGSPGGRADGLGSSQWRTATPPYPLAGLAQSGAGSGLAATVSAAHRDGSHTRGGLSPAGFTSPPRLPTCAAPSPAVAESGIRDPQVPERRGVSDQLLLLGLGVIVCRW